MTFLGMRGSAQAILGSTIALAAIAATNDAFAVSLGVQLACATDYYAHCSAYSPDSPQVRSCMRAVGNRLSRRCVNALVAAGEVSAAEVSRRRGISKTAAR
ncbi:hypothetical protein [Hyphomicrobium sp.]|jgi:hypothetical protein|uniref:hypothetical protein n=1 Tax=Hyphomicrobium sp. TaxID=82 RepID=UPI002BF09094|nr:hypothetical protein [Hyphomicrobium sp.]HVZ05245.1 hypothetical protein [Hyphomicrobium sp.]